MLVTGQLATDEQAMLMFRDEEIKSREVGRSPQGYMASFSVICTSK